MRSVECAHGGSSVRSGVSLGACDLTELVGRSFTVPSWARLGMGAIGRLVLGVLEIVELVGDL